MRAGLIRNPCRCQYGQWPAVGRLGRAEDACSLGGEQVAEPGRGAADPARAEPVRERALHRLPVDLRGPEPEHALRARLDPDTGVCRPAAAVQEVELELRERAVAERGAAVQHRRLAAARVPQRDRFVVTERRAEDRADRDVVAGRRHRQREAPAGGERRRLQGHRRAWCDLVAERGEWLRGEVGVPAADRGELLCGQAEERERRTGGNVAGETQHLDRAARVGGTRGAVQDRNELGEVLGEHERGRNGIGRLVVLAAQEGGAIADGEERETEARHQKGRRDRRMSGVAGKRRGGEAQRDRPAAPGAAGEPQRRPEQPRGRDRGCEDDQRGNEQQERAGAAAAACELRGPDRPACPAHEDDRDRPDRRDIERRQREPAQLRRGGADGRVEQDARDGGERKRAGDAARREQPVPDDVAGRRARAVSGDRRHGPAGDGACDRGGDGDRQRFGEGEQLHLPTPSAEPGQAAPCVCDVSAQRCSGKDRERKQQGTAFASEQQQPPGRGGRRPCGRGERAGRRGHLELVGARLDLRRQPLHPRSERVDRPRVHVTAPDRHEPAVGAIEGLELGRACQAGHAVRDHDG